RARRPPSRAAGLRPAAPPASPSRPPSRGRASRGRRPRRRAPGRPTSGRPGAGRARSALHGGGVRAAAEAAGRAALAGLAGRLTLGALGAALGARATCPAGPAAGPAHVTAAGERGAVLDDELAGADVALDDGRGLEDEPLLHGHLAVDAPADLGRRRVHLAIDAAVGHHDGAPLHLDVPVDGAADVDVAAGAEGALDDGVLPDDVVLLGGVHGGVARSVRRGGGGFWGGL